MSGRPVLLLLLLSARIAQGVVQEWSTSSLEQEKWPLCFCPNNCCILIELAPLTLLACCRSLYLVLLEYSVVEGLGLKIKSVLQSAS